MRCLDASFCFDLLRGEDGVAERARAFEREEERLAIPAPALAEVLRAGYRRGGRFLARILELVRRLEVLPLDEHSADEAGRLGGECDRRGRPLSTVDLLIAGIARTHGATLVTRDVGFQNAAGLRLETY